MQIVICDDDIQNNLVLIKSIDKDNDVQLFDNTQSCLKYIAFRTVDLVILSVCSKAINYQLIIDFILDSNHKSVICLVGETELQSVNVYQRNCDLFIKKPYRKSEIQHMLETSQLLAKRIQRIYVHTFGRFEVFVNGNVLDFHNAKAKELFALCIDRKGGFVTMDEVIDKLWEDRVYDERVKRLYRKAVQYIKKALAAHNLSNVFENRRGICFINTKYLECDYYEYLSSPVKNSFLFNGEYMFDYSWAENTLAVLMRTSDIYSKEYESSLTF